MRRVIIAHDRDGRSIVTSDAPLAPEDAPGVGLLYRAWSADTAAHYPKDGDDPGAPGLFPPVGGIRAHICAFAPGQSVEGMAGGDVQWEEGGMHRTDTTDINIVLDGEIVLGIDGGAEVRLGRGDTVVLGGARHCWRNEGTQIATVAFFMAGAQRTEGQ